MAEVKNKTPREITPRGFFYAAYKKHKKTAPA